MLLSFVKPKGFTRWSTTTRDGFPTRQISRQASLAFRQEVCLLKTFTACNHDMWIMFLQARTVSRWSRQVHAHSWTTTYITNAQASQIVTCVFDQDKCVLDQEMYPFDSNMYVFDFDTCDFNANIQLVLINTHVILGGFSNQSLHVTPLVMGVQLLRKKQFDENIRSYVQLESHSSQKQNLSRTRFERTSKVA